MPTRNDRSCRDGAHQRCARTGRANNITCAGDVEILALSSSDSGQDDSFLDTQPAHAITFCWVPSIGRSRDQLKERFFATEARRPQRRSEREKKERKKEGKQAAYFALGIGRGLCCAGGELNRGCGDDSFAFLDGDGLIGLDVGNGVCAAAGPEDLQADTFCVAGLA
jgi:hypothetical protein